MPDREVNLANSVEKLKLLWFREAIAIDYFEQPGSNDLQLLLRFWRGVDWTRTQRARLGFSSILTLEFVGNLWPKIATLSTRRLVIFEQVAKKLLGCRAEVVFARSRYGPVDGRP